MKFWPTKTASAPVHEEIYVSLDSLLKRRFAKPDLEVLNALRTHSLQAGDARSPGIGTGYEFDQLRVYQQGDDVRSIDWRVSARAGKPLTKVYNEDRDQAVCLFVDQRPSLFFASRGVFKSVLAAMWGAHLFWLALKTGARVGGLIASTEIKSFRLQKHREKAVAMLHELARSNRALHSMSQSSVNTLEIYATARRQCLPGTLIILVSDFHGHDKLQQSALNQLSRTNPLLLIVVSDALERDFLATGRIGVSNSQRHLTVQDGAMLRKTINAEYEKKMGLLLQLGNSTVLEISDKQLSNNNLNSTIAKRAYPDTAFSRTGKHD